MSDPVLVAVITGGFGTLGALLAAVVPRLVRQSRKIAEVHQEVRNSHKTNLRDDLDRALRGIDLLVEEFRNLRGDLALERRERIDLAHRLDVHLEVSP